MANFSELLKKASEISSKDINNDVAVASIATVSSEEPALMTLAAYTDDNIEQSLATTGIAYASDSWIRSGRYEWYDEFDDSNISTVDALKNIKLDSSQINLSQEELSQFIPFEMPRRYDNFDLATNTRIQFHYVNSQGYEDYANAVNVQYNDTKIRFALLVPYNMTYIAGLVEFEIIATGTNSKGENYKWISRAASVNVLKSLVGNGIINPTEADWYTQFVRDMDAKLAEAESAVAQAERAADRANTALTEVNEIAEDVATVVTNAQEIIEANVTETMTQTLTEELSNYDTSEEVDAKIASVDVSEQLENYALKSYVDEAIEGVDVTEQLQDYSKIEYVDEQITNINDNLTDNYFNKTETEQRVSSILEDYATKEYVSTAIEEADISDKLNDYYTKEETYTKEEIDTAISNVTVDLTGYATETYVDGKVSPLRTDIDKNISDIQTVNTAITSINQTLDSIDKTPNKTYEAIYNDTSDENVGENVFVLYEITNEGQEGESREVKSKFTITGGSGGSSSANTIKIERITNSPLVVTEDDKIEIEYNFIGTDASGDDISQGNATWKLGNRVIKTETVYTGINKADLTEYFNVGSDQKLTLIISDDIGSMQQKTWYVSVVDVKLESSFDDTRKYTAGSPVSFTYTPYGAVDKTLHFLLDGKEIGTKVSSKASSGLSDSYTIPAQSHGTHLFEVYMTAEVNGNILGIEEIVDEESGEVVGYNHTIKIVKDIIWYDETSDVPVIATTYQTFTARQYEATNITYTVYDPSTETPNVTLKATYVNEDGETVEEYNSNLVMLSNTDVWQYKTDVIGEHTLTITCGETVKTLVATVVELGINVTPTTAGLEFDFNPVGYSNNDANRLWKDSKTGVDMTVSSNFDWTNGGYQIDENGDQYFCVKAGTTATINYNLFADDAKDVGKEFKVIFKTSNVKKRDTSFISCMNGGIGLDMKVESANIYSSNGSLYSPYCEEDVIEFEFNINKSEDIPLVLTYEDGVGNRPMIYTSDSSFWQTEVQPITIGSDNCDVYIYRMKAYSTSLSDKDILNNFIADARSAEEMISRYDRNQIYKDGVLNPEYLAEVCPDLRIIMVDAPWFTNDKENKVEDTNITMIYKNGDSILDNWTCTGAKHSGQGTSSNEYGYAGRNIDLIMDTDTSLFTLGDGKTTSKTITLTRDSVPTDYLNVKVNIASSENQNNAQMARRYNQFNPFKRSAKFNDSKVKDCMEFFNCVIFVKERDEDISTHREFQDTNWHYYALGNVGDSKKTDDTRVNDKTDPKECIVEITDYNVPLAEFPTGYGENGKEICPVSEWKAGNTAYDFLYADYKYKDGKFKSFGSESYEFRYEMKGITEEQRQVNIDNWREMYKFVVTSTDEEFYARLKEYFVVDSALYFYLFTERYLMCDNRAKNSFWHYGKVYITEEEAITLGDSAGGYIIDNEQALIHDGYRWDLTQGYDFDKI